MHIGRNLSGLTESISAGNKKDGQAVFFIDYLPVQAEKEEPHPQVDVAFGFLITNCAPSRPS